ncbi:MAG: hypothetical protein ACLFVU_05115 [Phycisphaerae bacterium]
MRQTNKGLGILWAIALLVLAAVTLPSLAQNHGGSLQKKLDQKVNLTVTEATIPEVFARLTRATDVKFSIDDDVFELLPYGEETRLRVKLRDVTLRDALPKMLSPQALTWEVQDSKVHVRPVDALYRIGRRADYQELKLLGQLLSTEVQPTDSPETDLKTHVIDRLKQETDLKGLRVVYHVSPEQKDFARAEKALPGTPADWLDMLTHGQGWSWYVWGSNIVVVKKADQLSRQLQRGVSLRYKGADIADVLYDLVVKKGRTTLNLEPGVLKLLPSEARNEFNLMMSDATIHQALKVISGATGLEFAVTDEGVNITASESLKTAATTSARPARKEGRFIVKFPITVDGVSMEVFMRSDELPEDVRNRIDAERNALIERLLKEADRNQ